MQQVPVSDPITVKLGRLIVALGSRKLNAIAGTALAASVLTLSPNAIVLVVISWFVCLWLSTEPQEHALRRCYLRQYR